MSNVRKRNGWETLGQRLITGQGAIGVLTDTPDLTRTYAYKVCKEATSLGVGEFINLTTQVQQVDGSAQETCGLVQISGPQLSQIGEIIRSMRLGLLL